MRPGSDRGVTLREFRANDYVRDKAGRVEQGSRKEASPTDNFIFGGFQAKVKRRVEN